MAANTQKPYTAAQRAVFSTLARMGGKAPTDMLDGRAVRALMLRGDVRVYELSGRKWVEEA